MTIKCVFESLIEGALIINFSFIGFYCTLTHCYKSFKNSKEFRLYQCVIKYTFFQEALLQFLLCLLKSNLRTSIMLKLLLLTHVLCHIHGKVTVKKTEDFLFENSLIHGHSLEERHGHSLEEIHELEKRKAPEEQEKHGHSLEETLNVKKAKKCDISN